MKEFLDFLLEKAKVLSSENSFMNIYSHHDADGITSSAIMIKTLKRLGKEFHLKTIEMIDEEVIEDIEKKSGFFLFLDLGSGYLDMLKKTGKKMMIIDHHIPKEDPGDIIHINPLDFNLGPLSASTITFLFAKAIDEKNQDLAPLAVVGALGDRQKPIKEIINGKVEEKEDLRIFGKYLRNLPRALALSTEIYIPGVFNDEGAAVEFLRAINIEVMDGDNIRKISDLNEEEKKSLVAGIILRRKNMDKPEDIFGINHLLKDYGIYAEEFSTVLNAASRMGMPSKAISLCFEKNIVEKTREIMDQYSRIIGEEFSKVEKNRKETENTTFLFGENQKIIGTITSILLSDSEKQYIIGMAPRKNFFKISARTNSETNLGGLISEIAEKLGGMGGGHEKAAGALIPLDKKEEFIKIWENYLNTKLDL